MNDTASYRQILRASSISGGASAAVIAIGMVRMKVAAVVLGPAGVGLLGIYVNLMDSVSTLASLGLGMAATREIASAGGRGDILEVAAWRRAVQWAMTSLAVCAALVSWLIRDRLAAWLLQDASRAPDIGLLGVGVGLMVAAGSQTALLTGLRRIGDLARANLLAAAASTLAGAAALLMFGRSGLLAFVLAGPVSIFVTAWWFGRRVDLPRLEGSTQARRRWGRLLSVGAPLMLAALVGTLAQLLVRGAIQRELGDEGLGQFQAAWTVSMTSVGLVLQAMSADYYPRLTTLAQDPSAANRLVNEQTHVALLLASPVCLALLSLAPWVVQLLYSERFVEAAGLLRWQVLGDALKVASWPLGFLLLAAGRSRIYFLTEVIGLGVFVAATAAWLPQIGLAATGLAFIAMYVVYLPLVFWLAKAHSGFSWDVKVRRQLIAVGASALVVFIVAGRWPMAGACLGLMAATAFLVHGLGELALVTSIGGVGGRLAEMYRRAIDRLSKRRS